VWSMTVFLAVAIVAAYIFPVHLRYHTKAAMTTVPLFLTAVLLPVPIAVAVGAGATLAGELLVRRERGNLPIDIFITTLRWALILLVAGIVGHWPARVPLAETTRPLAAALVLFLGDSFTAALHVAQVSREHWWRVLGELWREAALVELAQYLLGLLGAFSALEHFWSPVLLLLPIAIIYLAFKQAKELQDSTRQILESMADAVDLRDSHTGGHSRRVADFCRQILRQLGISGAEADLIVAAARVHDIGKIGVPDHILLHPGQLERDQARVMQSHAQLGADMLLRYRDFTRGVACVRHHHERWDGQGYPVGLSDSAIPFGARFIAVADSYDAMTSQRPYRGSMTPEAACSILRAGRGTQWDASIVDAFVASLGDQIQSPPDSGAPASTETRQFSSRELPA
jgi:hypothetical protein